MRLLNLLTKPTWRTLIPTGFTLVLLGGWYLIWSPGSEITDGRHDRNRNGIWISHAWLGDDEWFDRQGRNDEIPTYREPDKIAALLKRLRSHHVTDIFAHVAPCRSTGELPPVNTEQVERFLDISGEPRVMAWVGGVFGQHCLPSETQWRQRFVEGVSALLNTHPRLAGIHLNIEPWPNGHADLLSLLDEIRIAIPDDKILSLAAYPPPTIWHRHPEIHWDQEYYSEIARRSDQLAVMLYDTALLSPKFYRSLMADWTCEVLDWSGDTSILLGVPAYDDAGVGYHHPDVENLAHGLAGIHAGLSQYPTLPENYQGIAVYSEWEMDDDEWTYLSKHFLNQKD